MRNYRMALETQNPPFRVVQSEPRHITDLKQFCKDEWPRVPPEHCVGLINRYRKYLLGVIALLLQVYIIVKTK